MASFEDPTLPRKLRMFVVRSGDARPIPGVVLEAYAELRPQGSNGLPENDVPDDGPTAAGVKPTAIGLGLLRSDHVGYVSFDLKRVRETVEELPDLGHLRKLWVVPVGNEAKRVDVLERLVATGERAFPIVLDGVFARSGGGDIPAVQSPDVRDWEASPRSFSSSTMQIVGQDGCEELLLSQAAVRSFNFTQIIRKPAVEALQLAPAPAGPCDLAPVTRPLCYRRGAVIEYVVEWVPRGHGLGEILYSLPLAPCETVRLAIIDWSRADTTTRGEDLTVAEQLAHNHRRERTVDEVMEGAITEWQRGGSVMGGLAGSYSSGSFSLAAAAGGVYTTSAGDRGITGSTVQTLDDGMAQSTTNVRRLSSTVVVQASQAEQERLQTRAVTNHNHCHALTVLYYEVVRHFAIRTSVRTVREVLLLKHPDQAFDRERLVRDADRLRPLLPEALRGGLDAAVRLAPLPPPPGTTPGIPVGGGGVAEPPASRDPLISKLIVDFITEDSGQNGDSNPQHWVTFQILVAAGVALQFRVDDPSSDADFRFAAARRDDDRTFMPGTVATCEFPLPTPILRSKLRRFGVHWRRDFADREAWWLLKAVHVRFVGPDTELTLMQETEVNRRFAEDSDFWFDVAPPLATAFPMPSADEVAIQKLLAHLEVRRHELNRILWMTEPSDRRAAWLERYLFGQGDLEGRLADFVENRVIDVTGEYVAVPLGKASPDLLKDLHIDVSATTERILSVPTRGAFAEAKLAHCNACEEIDATRYWDWQQSPCNCDPPEIAAISAGSRNAPLQATPTPVPGATTGVVTPEAAPAPAGIARVLDAITKSDVFRNMSGLPELSTFLGKLIDGAVQMEVEQIKRGNTDPKKEGKAEAGQGGATPTSGAGGAAGAATGSTAASGAVSPKAAALTTGSPADTDAGYRNAQKAIDRAAATGALTAQEQADLTRKLVESQVSKLDAEKPTSAKTLPTIAFVGTSPMSELQYLYWTKAVDPTHGGLRPDFLDYQSSAFSIEVRDASVAGSGAVTVDWNVEQNGLPYILFLDSTITCQEVPGEPGRFLSPKLGLVADHEDYVATPDPITGQSVPPTQKNHRLRVAPLDGSVVASYTSRAGDAKKMVEVFSRSRRRLKLYVHAIRKDATPSGHAPTMPGMVQTAFIGEQCERAVEALRALGIAVELDRNDGLPASANAVVQSTSSGPIHIIDPEVTLNQPLLVDEQRHYAAMPRDGVVRVFFVPALSSGAFEIFEPNAQDPWGCIFVRPGAPYELARAIALLLARKDVGGVTTFAWNGDRLNPEVLHLCAATPILWVGGPLESKRVWPGYDADGFDWRNSIGLSRWLKP